MHGNRSAFFGPDGTPNFIETSEDTLRRIEILQSKLEQKLGPEFISTRPGGGGTKLTYIEGWKLINIANEVFGFNGWSSQIVSAQIDFCDMSPDGSRCTMSVSAVVRVTLRDGVYHEDVGCGCAENQPRKTAAFDKAKKEAVTDALKRALRSFGNIMGNCLYDKNYCNEVSKIKVQPVRAPG
ncbi:Rad52/22 double-strand break repair protein [Auricularia subglabra TFB-10046 SS5]|nr:Rad52/22 double-strand break repair protein [Auricularia subglabra TFB-10046 SS5]